MLKNCATTQCASFPGVKWLLWVPMLALLDQISKWIIFDKFTLGQVKQVLPGMNFTLAFNPGVAFSFFSQREALGHFLLITTILIVCCYLTYMLIKTPLSNKISGIALVMILGGAIGNLWDRLTHGFVIDFVDLYVKNWHWYTFNLADCFITMGALILIINIMRSE